MNVILSTDFLNDLDNILDFIAENSLQNAQNFLDALYKKIAKISFMPWSFRQNPIANKEYIRDLIYKGFVVPFAIDDRQITILGIYKQNLWKPGNQI